MTEIAHGSTIYTETEDNRRLGEVATSLTRLLHQYGNVAYVLGLRQGRTVKNWAENGTTPVDPLMDTRLRVAEQLALTVREEERPGVSTAWLISCNPHLGDNSPAEMIRSLSGQAEDEQAIGKLQFAAADFAANRE
jgi:hypothetical protein